MKQYISEYDYNKVHTETETILSNIQDTFRELNLMYGDELDVQSMLETYTEINWIGRVALGWCPPDNTRDEEILSEACNILSTMGIIIEDTEVFEEGWVEIVANVSPLLSQQQYQACFFPPF
jgi:hypothetical protein